jgi:YD repeat-containing protein
LVRTRLHRRAYDSLDRLSSETTAQGTVSYTYDAAGRRVSASMPGGITASYGYDAASQLTVSLPPEVPSV